ncbi:MAG: hypothetical protein D9V47_11510 [Clostridia bacterium]|nr:MAG: hypothetical protein D9V47_11510 [Clostridia bacterium]
MTRVTVAPAETRERGDGYLFQPGVPGRPDRSCPGCSRTEFHIREAAGKTSPGFPGLAVRRLFTV